MSTHPIIREGANARALGRSQFDNPWYQRENMPASTGETLKDWQDKAVMWNFGWNLEEAQRYAHQPTGKP